MNSFKKKVFDKKTKNSSQHDDIARLNCTRVTK